MTSLFGKRKKSLDFRPKMMNHCTLSTYYKIITVFIGPQLILKTSDSQRVTLRELGLFVLFLYLFPALISFSVFML